jgi:hypothetical protein
MRQNVWGSFNKMISVHKFRVWFCSGHISIYRWFVKNTSLISEYSTGVINFILWALPPDTPFCGSLWDRTAPIDGPHERGLLLQWSLTIICFISLNCVLEWGEKSGTFWPYLVSWLEIDAKSSYLFLFMLFDYSMMFGSWVQIRALPYSLRISRRCTGTECFHFISHVHHDKYTRNAWTKGRTRWHKTCHSIIVPYCKPTRV